MKPIELRLAMALIVMLMLAGCAGMGARLEPPRVNLAGLELVDVQLFEQRYRLTLRVQNPNREAIEIDGIDFQVELNGRPFAEGVGRQAARVEGFGEALIEVEVTSTLFGLIDQLEALDQRRGDPLAYRIRGTLSLAGVPFGLPFDRSGEFRRPANRKEPAARM